MEEETKKEIQTRILEAKEKVSEKEFSSILKLISPGTALRTALEGALKTGRGALIVAENENLTPLIDGGFKINCRFTPQKLIELCKMDGAIVISKDFKRISYANVLLTPDSKIKTAETGSRHKAAERTAKEIGSLVIAISERKHEITLFYKNKKYSLKNTEEILRKANEHMQMVEKQKELFDKYLKNLNFLELRNYIKTDVAANVIQKGELIQRISEELKKCIIELGNEGFLLKVRLKELTSGVEKETDLVIKDYSNLDFKKSKRFIQELSYEELSNSDNILKSLACEKTSSIAPVRGWRMLSKTSLHESEIAELIRKTGTLGKVMNSNPELLKEILGEERSKTIKEEIKSIKINHMQMNEG